MIALLVWYEDHLAPTYLCTSLGRDLGSLIQPTNRLRRRAETNPCLAAELERTRKGPAQIHICQTCPLL